MNINNQKLIPCKYMNKQEFLLSVSSFTRLPSVIELQNESEKYSNFLNEIMKSQSSSSTKLSSENEKRFGEEFRLRRTLIKKMYYDTHILALAAGFTKQIMENLFQEARSLEINGAAAMARQFFAMIRNKERVLNEEVSLLARRDEMKGLRNQIKIMNNLIKQDCYNKSE